MTTTLFDSHAGDGEALAANGGTSLDLPTSKMPSPRQGHPFKKVKKYGSLNKKGGVGSPLGVRVGVCGGWVRSTAGGGVWATTARPAPHRQRDGATDTGQTDRHTQTDGLPRRDTLAPSLARLPPIPTT